MATNWYYARNKQKQGPITTDQLAQLLKVGQLQPTDMVLQEGAHIWVPVNSISELTGLPTANPLRYSPSVSTSLPWAAAVAMLLVAILGWVLFFTKSSEHTQPKQNRVVAANAGSTASIVEKKAAEAQALKARETVVKALAAKKAAEERAGQAFAALKTGDERIAVLKKDVDALVADKKKADQRVIASKSAVEKSLVKTKVAEERAAKALKAKQNAEEKAATLYLALQALVADKRKPKPKVEEGKTDNVYALRALGWNTKECMLCGNKRSKAAMVNYSDRQGFGFCDDCGKEALAFKVAFVNFEKGNAVPQETTDLAKAYVKSVEKLFPPNWMNNDADRAKALLLVSGFMSWRDLSKWESVWPDAITLGLKSTDINR